MPARPYDDPLVPRLTHLPDAMRRCPMPIIAICLDLIRLQNLLADVPDRVGGRRADRSIINARSATQRKELRLAIEKAQYQLAAWVCTNLPELYHVDRELHSDCAPLVAARGAIIAHVVATAKGLDAAHAAAIVPIGRQSDHMLARANVRKNTRAIVAAFADCFERLGPDATPR